MRRALLGGTVALCGGALGAWCLGGGTPVALQPAELLLLLLVAAVGPAVVAALAAGLLAGDRAGALGYGLLPLSALLLLATFSPEATLGTWPDTDLRFRVFGGVLVLGVLLRGRLAPWIGAGLFVASVAMGARLVPRLELVPPVAAPDRLVVLLTLDTARGDAFDFDTPGARAHSPRLSALAEESTVFRAAHSPIGFTGPAHASLLSGRSPWEHGVTSNGEALPPELPWLPERLREAGWSTRAYVSTSVLDASLGFDRGFEVFDSTFVGRLARSHPLLRFLGYRNLPGSVHGRVGGDTLELVDLEPDGPTFVWVHLYDAHWPYTPSLEAARRQGLDGPVDIPEELRSVVGPEHPLLQQGVSQYLAELDDLDALAGSLVERMPPEATLIVVGDHGEALGEDGRYFTHGHDSREHITHVPLLVRGPGWTPGPVDTAVSTRRVADTLAVACGLEAPAPLTPEVEPELVESVAVRGLSFGRPGDERFLSATLREGGEVLTIDAEGRLEGSLTLVPQAEALRRATREAAGGQLEPSMAAALEALGYLEQATAVAEEFQVEELEP
ncbi:MAG TPA: sulfatase [Myxococcota bacterium]|nr:sulfatase [Myxococcota bacterium]